MITKLGQLLTILLLLLLALLVIYVLADVISNNGSPDIPVTVVVTVVAPTNVATPYPPEFVSNCLFQHTTGQVLNPGCFDAIATAAAAKVP
jgi:hypothetical protein